MPEILDRPIVVSFLKQAFEQCPQLEGKSIKLMPPNADSVHSKGYQIHIQPNSVNFEKCMQPIIKKHNLSMIHEENTLIIFNP